MAFNFQVENDAFVTTVETLVATTSRKRPQRLLQLSCNHIAFLGSAKDAEFLDRKNREIDISHE